MNFPLLLVAIDTNLNVQARKKIDKHDFNQTEK